MEGSNVQYSNERNYSWAAFLILVGVMFLLNTTGVVGWGIWIYVVRFWPVLVILIGIRIILGNSLLARILGMLFTIGLTVGVFGISYMQFTEKEIPFLPEKVNEWVLKGGSGMFNLQQEILEESNKVSGYEYKDIVERKVAIDVGACKFTVSEDSIDEFISIDSKFPKNYTAPKLEHSEENGILDLSVSGASSKSFYLFYDESQYDIKLGQLLVPSSLDIKLGAGSGDISLESIPVKDFWAEVGAGKLDATFTTDSLPSGEVRLSVGAGKMNLTLPTRVGYVLEYDLGVGSITADGKEISGISGGRGKFSSSNYSSSDMKLNIYVTVGVGSFNIDSN